MRHLAASVVLVLAACSGTSQSASPDAAAADAVDVPAGPDVVDVPVVLDAPDVGIAVDALVVLDVPDAAVMLDAPVILDAPDAARARDAPDAADAPMVVDAPLPADDGPVGCATGRADCDHDPAATCEAVLATDGMNCGACGVRCCGPCIDGRCWADGIGLTVCPTGPGGCRSFPANLSTDPSHCGSCDRVCASGPRGTAVCASGACQLACDAGTGDCDAAPGDGCETDLATDHAHCGACGHACASDEVCAASACVPLVSCKDLRDRHLASTDGNYTVRVGGAATPVRCLMSVDGGGWTQVMNFPAGTTPSMVPGWNAGAVGSAYTDPGAPWRLSDASIRALVTDAYRAHGTATQCIGGACSIDVTLYWRPACAIDSGASSVACSTAFYDLAFARPTGNTSPCAWHAGLVDTRCGVAGGIITNHLTDGIVVCTGDPGSFVHACSLRGVEDPALTVWVR